MFRVLFLSTVSLIAVQIKLPIQETKRIKKKNLETKKGTTCQPEPLIADTRVAFYRKPQF